MNRRFHHLPVAFAFLTRVPIRHGEVTSMGATASFFPLVGAFIGSFCALTWIAANAVLSPAPSAVLALAIGMAITGAFHQDGLADCLDGFVGGWTPQQRLEILKDSRHGTYGVMILVVQVALQITLVASMSVAVGSVALILMHCLARVAAVSIMRSGNSVAAGLGTQYTSDTRRSDVAFAFGISIVISTGLAGWWAPAVLSAACLAAWLFAVWARRKIGGIVGDVLGASEQCAETTVLVMCSISIAQGFLPWWM